MKLPLSVAAVLVLTGCVGDNACLSEGCTSAGQTTTTTTTTTDDNSTTTTGTSSETGTPTNDDNTPVIVVIVPSGGGDTSAGGGTSVPSTTDTARTTFTVPRLPFAPVISGYLEWGNSAPVQQMQTRIIADNALNDQDLPTFNMGWYDGDLYIYASTPDGWLFNDSQDQVYQDDSAEIYLDTGAEFRETYDSNDYQILARHHGSSSDLFQWQFGLNSSNVGRPSIQYACSRVSGRTNCEYRVLGLGLYSGRTVGFDFHINDDDDGGSRDHKYGLCPIPDFTDQAWFRPAAFCRLVIQ